MKIRKRINKLLLVNYDLSIGFVFFIAYRYLFTWLLWYGRNVPPEPDDSYFYLSAAHNVLRPENFEEFRLTLFSLWLNLASLITGGNLEVAYKVNFYIGPILMFLALAFFLKKLERNKNKRLLAFIFLSLFTGNGAYHGFYWVVSSFYQLLLFFILTALYFENKRFNLKVLIPVFVAFIFMHPSSPLVLGIFVLILPFLLILDGKNIKFYLEKSLIISVIGLLITGIYVAVSSRYPQVESPESPFSALNLIRQILHGNIQPVSWPIIWNQYFAFFFLNPLTILASLSALYFCWIAGAKKLLALYFSSVVLVLISIFIPFGYRTLELTWSLTFIVLTYALIGLKKWISNNYNFLKYTPIVAFIIFFLVITNLNYVWINSVNINKNYSWDRSCPKNINGITFFNSNDALYAFQLYGINSKNTIFLTSSTPASLIDQNAYFVKGAIIPGQSENISSLQQFLTKNITRRPRPKEVSVVPENNWNKITMSSEKFNLILVEKNLKLEPITNCGNFVIYKIINV